MSCQPEFIFALCKSQIVSSWCSASPWQSFGPFDKEPGSRTQFRWEGRDNTLFECAPLQIAAVDRSFGGGQRFHPQRVTKHERQRGDWQFRQFFGGAVVVDQINAAAIKPNERAAGRRYYRAAGEACEACGRLVKVVD